MSAVPAGLAASLSGRYRIEREIGHGGMATVYLAHDLKHDRSVAIKVLHPELTHTLGPERFLREIATTAQFDHPHILSLLDSGVVEPTTAHGRQLLFYVMPYAEGESLRDSLKRQKQLPVEEALQITREVADALGYAHARGIVHRDIKPENILLSGGHARVADFGIAKAIDAAGSERLTETGLAIGTPAYMSPEQSMAEREIDGRSDLYALGCVLYEMLAGEPPYTGPTAQAIIAKRMTNPVPSVRTVRETVPPSVDAALATVLAKSPADRFPTAARFAEALGQDATTAPLVVRAHDKRKRAWGAAVVGTLALAVVAGWFVRHAQRAQVTPSASVIAVLPFLPSSSDTALARLGRDLVITISANLDKVGAIRTVDSRQVLAGADHSKADRGTTDAIALGKSLGAGSVVEGGIVRVGPDVRLDLKLLSTKGDSEPLARALIAGSPDSVSALTDSVTWALLRQVWRRGDPPSPSYASLTTRSVASLRAFLDGERLSEAGRFREAIDAYDAAFRADSTFWLAAWQLNNARSWTFEHDPDPDLARQIESHRAVFGERDRLLIEAGMVADTIPLVDYIARLRAITVRFPEDWSAWFAYADDLHHWGPMVGATNAEVRAALQRTVDLNPKLVPAWDHLFAASVGHDSAQEALALQSLSALGHDDPLSRLILATNGQLPVALRDSVARSLTTSTDWFNRVLSSIALSAHGYPASQVELNRRTITLAPHDSLVGFVWEAMAQAWAVRGAWDSALMAYQRAVSLGTRGISPVSLYAFAASGTRLGSLDPVRAVQQRAPAAAYLKGLPPGDPATKYGRALVAWADGILAVSRRDPSGLREARVSLQQSGGEAPFMERSLAAFELELTGAKQAAGESLAVLDLAGPPTKQNPYARSIAHLAASRLLLEQGDTTRALKLLVWHEAKVPMSAESPRTQVFSALAYYELARIEEAQGRTDLAHNHYEQFLRRYDMPPFAHQRMVDEAKASLRKLNGLSDAPATR